MVTMEIGILMESTEKGVFLDYGVQLLEDWPEWEPQRGALGNQRPAEGKACCRKV